MKFTAVIFDLDGTLYDNSSMKRHLIASNLSGLGMLFRERMARHRLAGEYFGSSDAAYEALFRTMSEVLPGGSPDNMRRWFFEDYLPAQVSSVRCFCHPKPWVMPLLRRLRESGTKLACFSDYGAVGPKLNALGIDTSLFDVIADAPSLGGFKPCREPFVRVASLLGTAPENTAVAGDRPDTDGAGAKAAGMEFICVSRHDDGMPVIDIE